MVWRVKEKNEANKSERGHPPVAFTGPDKLIRTQEAFVILFSHFFIVTEVSYSYIFVELSKTTYGLGEKIQKTVAVAKSVSDDCPDVKH